MLVSVLRGCQALLVDGNLDRWIYSGLREQTGVYKDCSIYVVGSC